MTQVIYKIINLVNDKFYVGSTTNKKVRFRQHRKLLRGNRHHCKHLQAAWNKYGEAKFDFVVVEEVPDGTSLQQIEDTYLMQHVGKAYCYNSGYRSDAPWRSAPAHATPNFGRAMAEPQKQKISQALKDFYAEDYFNHPRVGKQHSPETKAKISAAKMANPTKPWLDKERSADTRAKISATQRGRANPRKGQPMSEQGRANVAAATKRGEENHFYGKRPANADELQKRVYIQKPSGELEEAPSLTYIRDTFGVSIATIIRACRSGKPVQTGAASGWRMSYTPIEAPTIPAEYAQLPRTRQLAVAQGAAQYFTGVPCTRGHVGPRAVKGTCILCRREDEKRLRSQPPE